MLGLWQPGDWPPAAIAHQVRQRPADNPAAYYNVSKCCANAGFPYRPVYNSAILHHQHYILGSLFVRVLQDADML